MSREHTIELRKLHQRDTELCQQIVEAQQWHDASGKHLAKLMRIHDGCKKAIADLTLVKLNAKS